MRLRTVTGLLLVLGALAVSAPTRVDGIPTLKEQGVDVVLGNWRGIWGAPGITP